MLKQLFILFINNSLTKESIHNVIENTPKEESDSKRLAFIEMEFISILFQNIPYYLIREAQMSFIQEIDSYKENNHSKSDLIIELLISSILELSPCIRARIETEIYAHIYNIIREKTVDKEKLINVLKSNSLSAEYLCSLDLAKSYAIEQLNITGVDFKKEDFKDIISYQNYSKLNALQKGCKKIAFDKYSNEELEALIHLFKSLLNDESDHQFGKVIKKNYLPYLYKIFKHIEKRRDKVDPNQYTLSLN